MSSKSAIENLRFLRVNRPGLYLILQFVIVRQGSGINARIDCRLSVEIYGRTVSDLARTVRSSRFQLPDIFVVGFGGTAWNHFLACAIRVRFGPVVIAAATGSHFRCWDFDVVVLGGMTRLQIQ